MSDGAKKDGKDGHEPVFKRYSTRKHAPWFIGAGKTVQCRVLWLEHGPQDNAVSGKCRGLIHRRCGRWGQT
jgi:hypothetical protein